MEKSMLQVLLDIKVRAESFKDQKLTLNKARDSPPLPIEKLGWESLRDLLQRSGSRRAT